MRRAWLPLCSLVGATVLLASPARGDSRVSIEVGGVYAVSPMDGAEPSGERSINSLGGSPTVSTFRPSDSIAAFEVRPSFVIASGLRFAVGFRAGSTTGSNAPDGVKTDQASLVGGDLSLGYGRWLAGGRFLPFAEARFGFNNYDFTKNGAPAQEQQLRLDAVLGARLYLVKSMYVAASGFVGWGDRYGGTLAIGFDLIHYRMRGVLP